MRWDSGTSSSFKIDIKNRGDGFYRRPYVFKLLTSLFLCIYTYMSVYIQIDVNFSFFVLSELERIF